MGDVPSPINKPAEDVNKIIQFAIYDVAVTAFRAYAVAQLPFLGWPGISLMFDGLLKLYAGYIYKALAQVATFQIIDLQIAKEKQDYNDALARLKDARAKGDQDALAKSTKDLKAALARLIHFDGSATP